MPLPAPPRNLEKELARKLAWAVISTLETDSALKYRVRAWAWRLAVKMVSAKTQFALTNPLPPPDNGTAGGGAAGVSKRESARKRNPVRPPLRGGDDAGTVGAGAIDVRRRGAGQNRWESRPPTACTGGECRRRSGLSCLRRPASADDGWRCWDAAQEAPAESLDSGRYADSPDYRERDLEEGGRELHPAKDPEVTSGGERVL